MLHGARVIAMEFSPNGAIPYLARVDAGTIDFVRSLGPRIVSSGDLIGQFEAAWSADQTAMHHAASEKLYRIKDRAFAFVRERLSARESVSEVALQAEMIRWFGEEGLVTDAPPMVATGVHTGNPHYSPLPDTSASIGVPGLLLLDLWGKLDKPRAVYADITWVGHTGALPPRIGDAFETIVRARDAAVSLVAARVTTGEPIRGWEVDRAARDLIAAAGYGEQFVHRTGHSLGEEVHGNGVHMDDYETHDDRQILAGTGFTIEPGIYTPEFGVRTEINVVVSTRAATVTGPRQQAISRLDG
jgi:Xaa-Pro aminopeptidase